MLENILSRVCMYICLFPFFVNSVCTFEVAFGRLIYGTTV